MTRPLFAYLPEIQARILSAPYLILFCDYDGTLTPIVRHPDEAHFDPSRQELLARLAAHAQTTVAIISGRVLHDVQTRVGLPQLLYAGNHGLEIAGATFHYVNPVAEASRARIQELALLLEEPLRAIPGVWIENKQLTLTVHTRQVAEGDQNKVCEVLMESLIDSIPFVEVTGGIKIFEIRPRAQWNKGTAVRWIRDHLGQPGAMTLYLGDDLTDEDAFKSLPEGINVRVGSPTETAANYYLPSPHEVHRFLAWLAELPR